MFDSVSTLKDSTNINDVYIRYAHEVHLNVMLRPYKNERIYVPTLTLIYRERQLSVIKNQDKIASFIIMVNLCEIVYRQNIGWTSLNSCQSH